MSRALISIALAASAAAAQEDAGPTHLGEWRRSLHGLETPVAAAFAPDGTLYVAEAAAHRVRAFDPEGVERRSLGRRGAGEGELFEPSGVSVAPDGTVFVADAGNARVVAFGPDGATWSFGRHGAGPGELGAPAGIAVDGARVAVADPVGRRALVFDRGGALLASVDPGAHGEPSAPVAVAFAEGGDLLVLDAGTHRLERFDGEGRRVARLGGFGFFPGTFASPRGLAAAGGRLLVADTENHRVQVFEDAALRGLGLEPKPPAYVFGLHAIRPREGRGKLHYPWGVAVTTDRTRMAVCEPWDGRVQLVVRAAGAAPAPDPLRAGAGQASPHFGPRPAADGTLLLVTEPETARVTVHDLRQLTPDGERTPPILVSRFGGLGTRLGLFARPAGLELDLARRTAWVCDPLARRLTHLELRVDPAGELRQDFEMARFVRALDFERWELALEWPVVPVALALAGEELLVLDAANARVHVIGPDLAWRRSLGADVLRAPTDVALAPGGAPGGARVLVADRRLARVEVFSPAGERLAPLGEGELRAPFGLACAADGSLVVSDPGQDAVLRLDAAGAVLWRVGGRGIRSGEFLRPQGVALAAGDEVHVLDHGNHRGVVLALEDGAVLDAYGPRLYTLPVRQPERFRPEDYVE